MLTSVKRKEIIRLLGESLMRENICRALGCSKRDVSAAAGMIWFSVQAAELRTQSAVPEGV